MNKLIYDTLKTKLDNTEKRNEKENLRREKLIKIGTEKIYYKIWKYIFKNITEDFYDILIYINIDKKKDCNCVNKIKIKKELHKVHSTRVSISYLRELLEADGLSLNDSCWTGYYRISISRNDLKKIIQNIEDDKRSKKHNI